MRIGVMQPYLFPYIGYFQLISAVDKFIIYDDVYYIKQGWINRNRILVNNKPVYFSVPLKNASSYALIKETKVCTEMFNGWKDKFLRTLEQSYKKTPFYNETTALVEKVLQSHVESIAALAFKSICYVAEYLEIKTTIIETSAVFENSHLKSQERIIDICMQEKASQYINAAGGIDLYQKEDFEKNNIALNFIQPKLAPYKQFNNAFISGLSIIDVLMFNPKEKVRQFLFDYQLL
jgi:hypothetical protein